MQGMDVLRDRESSSADGQVILVNSESFPLGGAEKAA